MNSIKSQSITPFEVIVVVDGSTDSSLSWLQNQDILSDVKIHFQSNQGRSIVRNNGAEIAKGDLLLFVDDDMSLNCDCLEKHLLHHKSFKNCIVSGAQIDPSIKTRTDFQMFKHYLSIKWNNSLSQYGGMPLSKKNLYLTAANMSIRRDIFWTVGGFDTRLKDAEDYDLAVRANSIGYNIIYLPECIGWHYDDVSCQKYILRLIEYRNAHEILSIINPKLYPAGTKYSVRPPLGIKKYFFKMFSNNLFVRLVDIGFFKFAPRKIKFLIYSIIITANGTYFPDRFKLHEYNSGTTTRQI